MAENSLHPRRGCLNLLIINDFKHSPSGMVLYTSSLTDLAKLITSSDQMEGPMSEWVNEELRDLNLGDTRLNKRAKTIIQS